MKIPSDLGDWLFTVLLFVVGCAAIAGLMQIGSHRITFAERYLKVLVGFGSGITAMVGTLIAAATLGGRERVWPLIVGGLVGLFVTMPLGVGLAWWVARFFDPRW